MQYPASVLTGQVASFDVYGVTATNEKILIDASAVQWTIGNTAILAPYYGKFSGESVGTTTVTATYNGMTTAFSIAVVPPFKDITSTNMNTLPL